MTRNKILAYAIGPIGSGILGLISLPIITWFFSVEDVGRISMLQVVASFSVLLFCLGLDQAYTREYHEVKDTPQLLKLTLMPGLILTVIVYSFIFFIKPTLVSEWLYEIPSVYLSVISISCFILSIISRFLSLVLRMQEKALAFSMSQLLPKIIFLIFIISTVWLGFKKDIYTLVTAHFLSILAVFLVFSWNTRKEWLASFKYRFNWLRFKPLLLFGLPLVIGGLASWGLNVMDRLFLRGLSTFSELGVYSVTMSIVAVATVFSGIFNTIWAPLVYKWIKTEEVNLSKIDEISEHLLAAIYFIVVLSGLFSWVLPFFLPKEYAAIQYLITPCLLAPLFYTLSETTSVGIAIARKTGYSMLASIFAMLSNAIGNYLLVPEMGALGAAISTAISFWIFYILRTELSCKVWRKTPITKTYSVTLLLLTTVIVDSMFFEKIILSIIIWLLLAIVGLILFKSSLELAFIKAYKSYVKNNPI
ncbi:lipopolysaccharide biosynthesis protein [Psychrobacter faecalis]|uniref:lipopolysaccharide biosynthesis protein n=1 Tax=Psychrobacter faecalis TaxID=180588 RepID=UPI0028A7F14A|nr:oligosaccharide flippase family protein [Psychrobacter faecalis]